MAVCVAVIGKDNSPLFFQSSKGATELQYHFIVSSSLDIVEERVQLSSTKQIPVSASSVGEVTRELYLGALTAQEDYKVFGYMTNTRVKLVIVVEESNIPVRENDIRMMFRKLHGAFCDVMSNPFYQPGADINSKRFSAVVDSIISP